MFIKNSKDQFKNDTIIGESVLVDGNLDCLENVFVYGKVNGLIKTTENVYIKKSSIVNADIKSKSLFLEGEINGNIDCLDYVEVSSSAKINGNISTKIINIESGAVFNGKCVIKKEKENLDIIKKEPSSKTEKDSLKNKEKNKKIKPE